MDYDLDIEDEINSERLISLVKDYPGIYDVTLLVGQHLKDQLWNDICKKLIIGFEQRNMNQKEEIVKQVQNKWERLRSSFVREYYLRNAEEISPGYDRKKPYFMNRKKYDLYEQLLFLVPALNKLSDAKSIKEVMSRLPRTIAGKAIPPFVPSDGSHFNTSPSVSDEPLTVPPNNHSKPLGFEFNKEQQFTADPIEPNYKHIEEDRLFLLSLIPSLQRMTRNQKLEVKINFLKAIKNAEEMQDHTFSLPDHDDMDKPEMVTRKIWTSKPWTSNLFTINASTSKAPKTLCTETGDNSYHKIGNKNKRTCVVRELASPLEAAESTDLCETGELSNLETKVKENVESPDSLDSPIVMGQEKEG